MKMSVYSPILLLSLFSCGWFQSKSVPVAAAPEVPAAEVFQAEAGAAEGSVSWDKTVHDFGDVSATDGPLTCTFTFTNDGPDPVTVFEVVSSCGCTDVQWSRESVKPGESGTISATYKNDTGAAPFDKTLTVYISGIRRPVILRLRGVVHEKKKSLSELFGAEKLGDFGINSRELKAGTVHQGQSASETATVANLGKEALEVSFADVSPQLNLSVSPNPIPAGSTATLSYTVKADAALWGRNDYSATPVLNGKTAAGALTVTAWTQENFASWTAPQRENAALPMFEASTVSFGVVSSGEKVEGSFICTNKGKSALHFYKLDADSPALSLNDALGDIEPGKKGSVRFTLDTSSLPKGDNVIMLTLTTNAPARPLVNLFVAGEIR